MIQDLIRWIKKILNTPVSIVKPSEILLSGLKLLLVFTIFYFAIFQYIAPWERIKVDIFEYFSVGISLFCSWLIFWSIIGMVSKVTNRCIFQTFGMGCFGFLIIYTMMIGFHFLIKESTYGSGTYSVWNYYWHHLPYAFLICCVYYYRENKKVVIDNLVEQLNLQLEDIPVEKTQHKDRDRDQSRIHIKVDGDNRTIQPSYISHISVDGHYLDIYYHKEKSNEHFLIRKSLADIFKDLPKPPFVKIHRSHIVNLDYTSGIKKIKRQYWILLCDKQFSLPISKSNLSNLLSNLEQLS